MKHVNEVADGAFHFVFLGLRECCTLRFESLNMRHFRRNYSNHFYMVQRYRSAPGQYIIMLTVAV